MTDAFVTNLNYPTPYPAEPVEGQQAVVPTAGRQRRRTGPGPITLVLPNRPTLRVEPPVVPEVSASDGIGQAVSAAIATALAAQTELADKYHLAARRAERLEARVAALVEERDALAAELGSRVGALEEALTTRVAALQTAYALETEALVAERDRLAVDLAEVFARGELQLEEARAGALQALTAERALKMEAVTEERERGVGTVADALTDLVRISFMDALEAKLAEHTLLADRYAAATHRIGELEARVGHLTAQVGGAHRWRHEDAGVAADGRALTWDRFWRWLATVTR